MPKKHYSHQQRLEILSQFRTSSTSAEQFAADHGVAVGTLYRWLKEGFVCREESTPIFKEIEIDPSPAEETEKNSVPSSEQGITLHLGQALRLEFPLSIAPTLLASMIGAIRSHDSNSSAN